jgi:hypothetical protein
MAKQMSVLTLSGNIGRINFFKNRTGFQARERGGVPKSRIMSDPKFARTRENIAEFATNAAASRILKDAVRPAIQRFKDNRMHLRLSSKMMQVLKSDPVNVRGERQVAEGDWSLVKGLEMNEMTPLSSSLKMDYALSDSPTEWGINIPAFSPKDEVLVPEGASHMRVILAAAAVDFATGEKSFQLAQSVEVPVGAPSSGLNLSILKSGLVQSHKVVLVGVEFLQVVNGEYYPLNNGSNASGAIVFTERS